MVFKGAEMWNAIIAMFEKGTAKQKQQGIFDHVSYKRYMLYYSALYAIYNTFHCKIMLN